MGENDETYSQTSEMANAAEVGGARGSSCRIFLARSPMQGRVGDVAMVEWGRSKRGKL
jgi:hypothetical protein